jgi:hypothetical protein
MKDFRLFLFACCCFSASNNLFAQSPKAIEAALLRSFNRIDYWDQQRSKDATMAWSDSLEKANDVFAKKLKGYIQKYPSTITYPFSLLVKEHLYISSSTDGLFRIYSWDTRTGGTTQFFENVLQYKTGSSFKAIIDTPKSEGDNRPNYHKMFTLQTNGHSYYLSVYLDIGSTKDIADGIHIFTIENGRLTDAKLIKTHSGLRSDLSYDYDFGSVVNIDFEKRPVIRFDNTTKTIYLPLVDGNRQMTNKFILYKFNGQYFERVKD